MDIYTNPLIQGINDLGKVELPLIYLRLECFSFTVSTVFHIIFWSFVGMYTRTVNALVGWEDNKASLKIELDFGSVIYSF